jgi:hypothetical protein
VIAASIECLSRERTFTIKDMDDILTFIAKWRAKIHKAAAKLHEVIDKPKL